jgi:uncharacterized membrane protein SpoIIM required for sporulation
MVLESIFNPFTVKKKPWEMFLAGFIYSIIAVALAFFVFKEISSILLVFLIVLASLPLLYTTIKNEEELDLKFDREFSMLKEHSKVLMFLICLFLGITAGLVLVYLILPQSTVDTVFNLQSQAIVNINNNVQGNITGAYLKFTIFVKIFMNNLKVLFFSLLFSFLYGTGAIFILTWNASVIATAMGGLIKSELAQSASLVGFPAVSAYFSVATFSFFRYMTHGLLEIAAYFVAGLAGGIISIALIKHNLKEDKVLIDALDLTLISLGLLLVACVVEVYITPILFA